MTESLCAPTAVVSSGEWSHSNIRFGASRECERTSEPRHETLSTIGDLELNPLGLFDPSLDRTGRGQHAGKLFLGIGLSHSLGELGRIAKFELFHGIHPGGPQKLGI